MLKNSAQVTEIDQNSMVYFHNIVVLIYIQTKIMKDSDFGCLTVTKEQV